MNQRASNDARIIALLKRTGYDMVQVNGQRTYGGPPPGWEGQPPPRGCEVFVGKIPRDLMEDELVPVFERIGRLYEVRLMMDFSGTNRGFAYVRYCSRDDAKRACRELNNFEIRKGECIGVVESVDNCRLFIGQLPRTKTRDEVKSEISKLTEGVVDVILYPSANDKTKNRGFAFVEYENHKTAAMARRRLAGSKPPQLFGSNIQVDWAEPEQNVDEETMSQVKVLYVRNLMIHTSEEHLRAVFEGLKSGSVERLKKIKDFAFVHFHRREDAQRAMDMLNGKDIDGAIVEIEWSKPPEKPLQRFMKTATKLTTNPMMQHPNIHNNLVNVAANLYQANAQGGYPLLGIANPQAGLHPLVQSPTGGPTGLQQAHPGMAALRPNRAAAGMRSAGYQQAMANFVKNAKYSKAQRGTIYDLLPVTYVPQINPIFAFPAYKPLIDTVEEYCAKFNFGKPEYFTFKTPGKDLTGKDVLQYQCRLTVPNIMQQCGNFISTMPFETPEAAQESAAQVFLARMGLPIPGEVTLPAVTDSPPPPIFDHTTAVYPTHHQVTSAMVTQPMTFDPGYAAVTVVTTGQLVTSVPETRFLQAATLPSLHDETESWFQPGICRMSQAQARSTPPLMSTIMASNSQQCLSTRVHPSQQLDGQGGLLAPHPTGGHVQMAQPTTANQFQMAQEPGSQSYRYAPAMPQRPAGLTEHISQELARHLTFTDVVGGRAIRGSGGGGSSDGEGSASLSPDSGTGSAPGSAPDGGANRFAVFGAANAGGAHQQRQAVVAQARNNIGAINHVEGLLAKETAVTTATPMTVYQQPAATAALMGMGGLAPPVSAAQLVNPAAIQNWLYPQQLLPFFGAPTADSDSPSASNLGSPTYPTANMAAMRHFKA